MAQEIVSRHKHNMLSLLYATCLKLLVFFYIVQLLIIQYYNISFIALLPKKDPEHARFNVHETVTTVSV